MRSPPGALVMKLKLSDGLGEITRTLAALIKFLIVKPPTVEIWHPTAQQAPRTSEVRMAKAMGSCGDHQRASACYEWKLFLRLGQNLSSSPLALCSSSTPT